jgi:hypothetical protein
MGESNLILRFIIAEAKIMPRVEGSEVKSTSTCLDLTTCPNQHRKTCLHLKIMEEQLTTQFAYKPTKLSYTHGFCLHNGFDFECWWWWWYLILLNKYIHYSIIKLLLHVKLLNSLFRASNAQFASERDFDCCWNLPVIKSNTIRQSNVHLKIVIHAKTVFVVAFITGD